MAMTATPGRERTRILIVSDAVAPTGFARVVRGIFEPLIGCYELHQLAINYYGDPHDWPWKLYPAQRDGDLFGTARLEHLIEVLAPDLVFLLTDIWCFARYSPRLKSRASASPRIVFYCPIEAGPIAPDFIQPLSVLDHLVFYTRYGQAEIEAGAQSLPDHAHPCRLPPTSVLPHGVDTCSFFPLAGDVGEEAIRESRAQARKELFPDTPEFRDAFIVLNANRNQPRKRIDLTLEAFALFARDKPANVKLYMHMGLEDLGWDIPVLARRLGIFDRLIVTSPDKHLSQAPVPYLNTIYNACDVGINSAMAEGWGLVAFEHAATGAPQLVPGFGACAEIWQGVADLLPPARKMTQEQTLMDCFLIDPADAAAALERLYRDPGYRRSRGEAAYAMATRAEYQWANIAPRWADLFEAVLAEGRRPHYRSAGGSEARLPPPYLFLHIPKTGGTSLGELLRKSVGSEDFGQYWGLPGPRLAAEVIRKKYVLGHFPYGIHTMFSSPCTYVALLRNPYERVLSHYFFHLYNPSDPGHELARNHTLEQWLDLHPDAWDLQVQFLSGRKGPAPDQEALELAKTNLRACGMVGLQEDFEGTLLLMQFFLGLSNLSMPRFKENAYRPQLHEVSVEAREKIQRCNALDFELYQLGRELFSAQLQKAMAAAVEILEPEAVESGPGTIEVMGPAG